MKQVEYLTKLLYPSEVVDMQAWLNEAGMFGWQLICVLDTTDYTQNLYLFSRLSDKDVT